MNKLRGNMRNHPSLRGSRAFHALQRWRAERYTKVDRSLTNHPEILEALLRDGVAVVPGYLSREKAEGWLDQALPFLEQARRGELPDHTYTNQPKIIARLSPAEEFLPESAEFFNDAMIINLMRAALNPNVVSYRHEFDYRYGKAADDEVRMADLYHFDNWRPIYKAFLYLTDVSEESGPFVYMPGTHVGGAWRIRKEREFDSLGTTQSFGHFFPQEIRALREQFGWEPQIMTGEAGTLILADLRGLHRGTPMTTGSRVLLTNVFDLMQRPTQD